MTCQGTGLGRDYHYSSWEDNGLRRSFVIHRNHKLATSLYCPSRDAVAHMLLLGDMQSVYLNMLEHRAVHALYLQVKGVGTSATHHNMFLHGRRRGNGGDCQIFSIMCISQAYKQGIA